MLQSPTSDCSFVLYAGAGVYFRRAKSDGKQAAGGGGRVKHDTIGANLGDYKSRDMGPRLTAQKDSQSSLNSANKAVSRQNPKTTVRPLRTFVVGGGG